MRVRLKGINTVRKRLADGTIQTYHYHRASGTRLQGEPGTAEFLASFEEAGRAAALARSTGTVEWLIRQYKASPAWAKLAASTREIGALDLKACEEKWGSTPLTIVQNPRSRPAFLKWHATRAAQHPRAADAKLAGHSQAHAQHILDRYLARTRTLAESAIAKLDVHRRNQLGRAPTLS